MSDPSNAASLASLFLAGLARFPDRPALCVGGETFSYTALGGRVAGLAQTIKTLDPAPDKRRAAVFAYRSAVAYQGVLGTLLTGKAYVPLNPRFPAERSLRMLEAADVAAVIVDRRSTAAAAATLALSDKEYLVLLPEHDTVPDELAGLSRCRCVVGPDFLSAEPDPQPPAVAPDDGAYLLFTSGSTGTPKGVLVTHANALAYVANAAAVLNADENDRFSQTFDMTFDVSVHDMFVCWSVGACLCSLPEQALIGPAAYIREQKITCWFSVPSTAGFMQRFGMLTPGAYPGWRSGVFAGEALPASLAAAWRVAAPNCVLHNFYGPTEATVSVTFAPWRDENDSAPDGGVPIGRPFSDQKIAVVDENLRRVPVGERGELCLGGSQVAPGYWRAPDLTADRFVALPEDGDGAENRWYRTGDVVSWDDRLGLLFHGRADRQIKIRGYRVEIGEIETALRAAADTQFAAALGWPKVSPGVAGGVVAFVAGTAQSPAAIVAGCKTRLPDYMIPNRVTTLDALPLNANGKVDYKALERMLETPHG